MQEQTIDGPDPPRFSGAMEPLKGRRGLIRRMREEKGWTQLQLASEAKLTPSTVYRIESDRQTANDESIAAAAHALGIQTPGRFEATQSFPESTGGGMGQMIGAMMLPAGSPDIYLALLEYAAERGDPPHVVPALAAARKRAPANAGIAWWLDVYLTARLTQPPKR